MTIPSRLEEMEAVHELIEQAVKEYKLSDELAHWIELTISESMINAIQHGNQADPAKKATLKISSNGDSIEIIVEDQGCGFGPGDDGTDQGFGGDFAAFGENGEPQIAQNLHGIDPSFKAAGFVAEESGALADC